MFFFFKQMMSNNQLLKELLAAHRFMALIMNVASVIAYVTRMQNIDFKGLDVHSKTKDI